MKIKIKIKSSDCSDRAREIRLCSRARRRVCGASPSSASVLSGLQRRSRPVCVLRGFTAVGGSPHDVLVTSLTQINCGFCHQTLQLWLVNLTGTKVTHKDGAKHNPPGLKQLCAANFGSLNCIGFQTLGFLSSCMCVLSSKGNLNPLENAEELKSSTEPKHVFPTKTSLSAWLGRFLG